MRARQVRQRPEGPHAAGQTAVAQTSHWSATTGRRARRGRRRATAAAATRPRGVPKAAVRLAPICVWSWWSLLFQAGTELAGQFGGGLGGFGVEVGESFGQGAQQGADAVGVA